MNKPSRKLDVAVIEASAITEEGGIVPGASVGASPELVQMADKVIIEVNTASPSLEGVHDISLSDNPPYKPYLVMSPQDRIGTPYIPVDPDKVVARHRRSGLPGPNAVERSGRRRIPRDRIQPHRLLETRSRQRPDVT